MESRLADSRRALARVRVGRLVSRDDGDAGDRGTTALEYGLIIFFVMVALLVALILFGDNLKSLFGIGGENAEGLGDEAVVVTEPDRPCNDPTCAVTRGNNLVFDVRSIVGRHNAKVGNITVTPVAGFESTGTGVTSVAGNNGSFMLTAPTEPTQLVVSYTYTYRSGATLVSGTKNATVIVG